MLEKNLLSKLTLYFEKRSDIAFAFILVFGSLAKGTATNRSDVDIAVYFHPATRRPVEYEASITYVAENVIWEDIEKMGYFSFQVGNPTLV